MAQTEAEDLIPDRRQGQLDVPEQAQRVVPRALTEVEHARREVGSQLHLPVVQVVDGEAGQRVGDPGVVAQPFAQLPRALVGTLDLGLGVASGGDDRGAEGQLHLDLHLVPGQPGREPFRKLDRAPQLGDGLAVPGPLRRLLGRAPVVRHGRLGLVRRLPVAGDHSRLRQRVVAQPSLQRRGDASVKGPPGAAQQGLVGGVLHERVLEGVRRVGRLAAPV